MLDVSDKIMAFI